MEDKQNNEGVLQMDKVIHAIEQPRGQTGPYIKEKEELPLRQIIAGINSEWQAVNDQEKNRTILTTRLWTGEMMNWARIQMKMWVEKEERT
eukprot:5075045-Pleurochrysis_carterae.AAC.2